jgi:hypothetical protein
MWKNFWQSDAPRALVRTREKITSYKQFPARMLNSLMPLLVFSTMACAQQLIMPPKSEDRPLEDRITSM